MWRLAADLAAVPQIVVGEHDGDHDGLALGTQYLTERMDLAHRRQPLADLRPQCRADTEEEAHTPEDDPDGDADEDADRRAVCDVIHEEPEEHSADDSADQEPAKAREVAATQASVGVVIGHPERSLSIWSTRALKSAENAGVDACASRRTLSQDPA